MNITKKIKETERKNRRNHRPFIRYALMTSIRIIISLIKMCEN